ncbi:ABC transporter permease subunit [Puniceicoccaceae bacterium K14]|nr:ABC transporter permease subunit [Puniceicoccaceae bacterium K14]
MSEAANNQKNEVIDLAHVEKGSSLWSDSWRRLSKNHLAVGGGFLLLAIAIVCVLGIWIGQSHEEQNLSLGPTAPSSDHWLGTDMLGRDMLARILFGGRISLLVGLVATFVSLVIGVIYGTVSGYIGGKVDSVMMRIVDILYTIPFIIFVILLMVFFGRNLVLIFVAIGAVEWLTMARIVRGQVLSIKNEEFIEAAQALGLSRMRIIFRHIIPNVIGPVIVYATLTVPSVMLLEAVLSFLGLGVQAPATSWGALIKEGADAMEEYPWMLLFPGGALAITLFCLNFLGDGLRDALDVRRSKD